MVRLLVVGGAACLLAAAGALGAQSASGLGISGGGNGGGETPAEANLEVLAARAAAKGDGAAADARRDKDRARLLQDEAAADRAAEREARARYVAEGAKADAEGAKAHAALARAGTIRDEIRLVKQRIDSIEAECRRGKDFLRTLYAKRAGDETQLRDRAYEMGRERHVEAQIDHGALDHNSEASVRVMARPNAVGTSGSVLLQLDEDDDDDEISDGADGDLLLSGDDMVDDEEDGLGPNDAGADDEEEEEDDDDEEENNNDDDDAEDADLLYVAGSGPANSELPAAKRLELARAKRRAAVQAAYLARVVESLHGAIRADRKRELSEEKQLALCARRVEAARTRLAVLSASLNDATRTAHTALEEEQIGARAAAKDKLNADNARDKALADEQAATRAEREEMQLEVAASRDRNEAKALDREAKTVGENDRKEEEQRREAQEKERAEMKAAARREEELDKKIVFPNA